MIPSDLLHLAIRPTLELLGPKYQGHNAERMLIAIAMQESRITHRRQIGGPARGFWQFETGGVAGVLRHAASKADAERLCEALNYRPEVSLIHVALEHNDILACGFARLLLWTDAAPLPETEEAGWGYYLRNWRPGRPHPSAWPNAWRTANEALA
jgi:hypothetical protein